ncbi:MAG TPA: TIGR03617 family F420-dependent LLM class oxidoreductase [Candidatus Entotheonella sp.]
MIHLDTGLGTHFSELGQVAQVARDAEATGFGAMWSAETRHDPFMPLVLAAEHTSHIRLGTAVAIAFPRSPMVFANIGWDLAKFSGGRFILGLGTQVKGHNERRFSTPWVPPGPRLRDMILAIRAIWDSWQNGTRLNFHSEHYTHTLMTPFFNPGPIEHPDVPIYIGGVNPYMCRMAGEVADGLLMHSLNSVTYIRTVVLPAIDQGLHKSGRSRSDFTLRGTVFPVLAETEEELELARAAVRQRIAFYASTRTYKAVLDAHGWGDLTDQLHGMASRGAWEAMGYEITDEMLDAFCVTSTPDELGVKLRERFDGLVDRLFLNLTYEPTAKKLDWRRLIRELAA